MLAVLVVLGTPARGAETPGTTCPPGTVPVGDACTHGFDPKPDGATAPLPLSTRALGTSALCSDPGSDGNRVQALYVHPDLIASRLESFRQNFTQYAVDVDLAFDASAAETGGSRHVRFLTDSSCNLRIDDVAASAATIAEAGISGNSAFTALIDQLKIKGYNRTDRKYLIWFDASDSLCGIGTMRFDDAAELSNANNTHTGYARVDADCWGHSEKHELMHTFGAVQNSAPHSSKLVGGVGHCTDDYDVMCYPDAPGVTVTHTACPDPSHEALFDCNHDDYYSTAPAPGSYLATHWNTANSSWLDVGSSGTGGDTVPPSCGSPTIKSRSISVNVRDNDSGLASIEPTPSNLTVTVPSFSEGTTDPVTVVGKKVHRAKRARLVLTVKDVAGNLATCAYKVP